MSVRASAWAWEQSIPPNGKIVLLALADHAHDDGRNAFPSIARLARKTGYSERQTQRILAELCRAGVIAVQAEATAGRPTVYLLRIGTEFVVARDDFKTGSASPELRHALIVRDDMTCVHCGRSGDEACDPEGRPWEADRVEPGGEYTLDNTVLSCRRCNRARGRGDMMTPGGATRVTPGGDMDDARGGDMDDALTVIEPSIQPSRKMPEPSAPASAETVNQRANRLAKVYTDLQPMSRFPAIAGIVKRAIAAGHPDDAITDALVRLAAEGRSVTVETLRIELEGLPSERQRASGTRMYVQVARDLDASTIPALEV